MNDFNSMRRLLKRNITSSKTLLLIIGRLFGSLPKVFCYHRFSAPHESVAHRVNAATFAWQLDAIIRDYKVITLGQCIDEFSMHGKWPERCVVLTIDDGYQDMYVWAWPELKKRGLSATFFVTTGFVDGAQWLWPDRLRYALQQTTNTECILPVDGSEMVLALDSVERRSATWEMCSDHCISLPDKERQAFICQVEESLGVTLPSTPPAEFAAVSWEQLREMSAGGLEVGGHTVTHPILSKIDIDLLDEEIGRCRQVLQERLLTRIESFCYPNGCPDDINGVVVEAVVRAGYSGAVVVGGQGCSLTQWDRYQIPRMTVSNDRVDLLWKLYGGEALLCSLRKRLEHA